MLLFLRHSLARGWVAVMAGAGLGVFCLQALADWGVRLHCDNPALVTAMAHDSLLGAMANGEFWPFVRGMGGQILHHPDGWLYLEQLRFDHVVAWDEILPLRSLWAVASAWLTEIVFAVMVLLGGAAFWQVLRRAWAARRMSLGDLGLLALWLFYAASVGTRAGRYIYEEAVMAPVLTMAALGSLWSARDVLAARFGAARLALLARSGLFVLASVSAMSQIVLIAGYLPQATGRWAVPGYIAGQSHSISLYGYQDLRQNILATARMCGILPERHPSHVIIDELTSFAMAPVSRPIFAAYTDQRSWGGGIADLHDYFASIGSGGMVVACSSMPRSLRAEAVENGGFCCLPAFSPKPAPTSPRP